MRHALARQVDVEVSTLQFSRAAHGKPELLLPGSPRFNLSHSGPVTALALTHSVEVGVDVEVPRRRRDVLALAQRYFAPAETAALEGLESASRDVAFYALWTCKEAVLKALGRGIAFGLDRLEFELNVIDGLPRSLIRIAEEGGLATEWRIFRFEPTPGGFGALAWRGPSLAVHGFVGSD